MKPLTKAQGFILLTIFMIIWIFYVKIESRTRLKSLLQNFGIVHKRLDRAVREIERKSIHLSGVLIPLTYQLTVDHYGVEKGWKYITILGWSMTICVWTLDILRVSIPWLKENWPLQKYLREKEKDNITGMCYFSLGCTIAITLATPAVSMTSILFLVLGDLSAAIFGVAFGNDVVVVKLGREGKKSAEGSIAMFIICCITGFLMFWNVHLREYPIFWGAFAATLTELYEPLHLNDNLTIPLITSITLSWGFNRIQDCGDQSMLARVFGVL